MRILLLLLLTAPLLFAEPVAEKKAPDPQTQALEKRLKAWMIPKLHFEDAGIEDVMGFMDQICRAKSRDADQAVNFVSLLPEPKPIVITLQFDNISVFHAVEFISQVADYRFELKGNIVYFKPRQAAPKKPKAAAQPGQASPEQTAAVHKALKKLIIPKLSLEQATLAEATDFLTRLSRDQGRGVSIILQTKRKPGPPVVGGVPKGFFDGFGDIGVDGAKIPNDFFDDPIFDDFKDPNPKGLDAAPKKDHQPHISVTLRHVPYYDVLDILCTKTRTAWYVGERAIIIYDK